MSRWRDPQLQVNENDSVSTIGRSAIFKSCWVMSCLKCFVFAWFWLSTNNIVPRDSTRWSLPVIQLNFFKIFNIILGPLWSVRLHRTSCKHNIGFNSRLHNYKFIIKLSIIRANTAVQCEGISGWPLSGHEILIKGKLHVCRLYTALHQRWQFTIITYIDT